MADDDELTRLRAENQALRAQLEHALAQLAQVSEQLAAAQTRIATLEQQPPKLPPFVKPNKPVPAEPKRKRKKRAPEHNQGRRRMTPTRSVPHTLDRCPTCDYLLQGDSLDYTREVIELPEPQPIEVIEHRIIKRFCPHCRRWHAPSLDLTGQVLGQGRIGVRIASLVAFLALGLRWRMRPIQVYLQTVHQLTISTGEVVELLHAVRRRLQPHV